MTTTKTRSTLASEVRTAVARLARRLRQEGTEDATPSQLTALATLYVNGPMAPGELAAHERVKPPSMTRIVAALEEKGLVAREQGKDARFVRISLTDAGRTVYETYRRRRDAWLFEQMKSLSADERDVLEKAAEIMTRLVERP
jgi:DNA-binding MarR family transcriptional regulator